MPTWWRCGLLRRRGAPRGRARARAVERKAFSDTAQVDARPRLRQARARALPVELEDGEANARARRGDLIGAGPGSAPRGFAPELDNWSGSDVEGSVGETRRGEA